MAGATAPPAGEEEGQISVRFTTKLGDEFRVPDAPITVPANLARLGLSQVINGLLGLDPPRPFDFLVDEQLLRLSLHKHLLARGVTAEAVLEVEYLPAVLPPTPREQHPHEDWVATLAPLAGESPADALLAAGCYDGVVRLWRGGEAGGSWAAHAGPVKAAVAVGGVGVGVGMLLTAGNDQVARLWRHLDQQQPEPVAVLKGHTDSVEAAAASPSSTLAATGGWDGRLLVWRCGAPLAAAADEVQAGGGGGKKGAKKRRVGEAGVAVAAHEEAPRTEYTGGHTQCVSALSWPQEGTLVSGSWDHSVRVWDVETGINTQTLNHNKAVYALAAAPGSSGAPVAFGGAERALRVWDPRARGGEVLAVTPLASHTDWIVAVAWHPTSAHHLATASHDKTAKLWDLRAPIPLHTLAGHTDKVLCAGWVGAGAALATGGADSQLRTWAVAL